MDSNNNEQPATRRSGRLAASSPKPEDFYRLRRRKARTEGVKKVNGVRKITMRQRKLERSMRESGHQEGNHIDSESPFRSTPGLSHPKIREAEQKGTLTRGKLLWYGDMPHNVNIPMAGNPKDENAPRRIKQRAQSSLQDPAQDPAENQPGLEQAGNQHEERSREGEPCLEPGLEDQDIIPQSTWSEPSADQACHCDFCLEPSTLLEPDEQ